MDDRKQNLQQQDHPLKNTDDAFVQVGKNGEPLMPGFDENDTENKIENGNDVPPAHDKL